MNVRIMYDQSPIRHLAVQCPDCERWFKGNDIGDRRIDFEYELHIAKFTCPVCGKVFNADALSGHHNVKIEECDNHNDVYKDIYQRVETWQKL